MGSTQSLGAASPLLSLLPSPSSPSLSPLSPLPHLPTRSHALFFLFCFHHTRLLRPTTAFCSMKCAVWWLNPARQCSRRGASRREAAPRPPRPSRSALRPSIAPRFPPPRPSPPPILLLPSAPISAGTWRLASRFVHLIRPTLLCSLAWVCNTACHSEVLYAREQVGLVRRSGRQWRLPRHARSSSRVTRARAVQRGERDCQHRRAPVPRRSSAGLVASQRFLASRSTFAPRVVWSAPVAHRSSSPPPSPPVASLPRLRLVRLSLPRRCLRRASVSPAPPWRVDRTLDVFLRGGGFFPRQ